MQQGLKFHIAGFLIEMPGIFYYFKSGIKVISQAMSHGKRLVHVIVRMVNEEFAAIAFYFFPIKAFHECLAYSVKIIIAYELVICGDQKCSPDFFIFQQIQDECAAQAVPDNNRILI